MQGGALTSDARCLLSLTWVGGRKGGVLVATTVSGHCAETLKWWTSLIFVTAEAGDGLADFGPWALDIAITSWGPQSLHSALFAQ